MVYQRRCRLRSGGAGAILKSEDEGRTWTVVWTGRDDFIPYAGGIVFPTADVGYVTTATMLLETRDGGATWEVHEPPADIRGLGVVFSAGQGVLYVIGDDSQATEALLAVGR